MDNEKSVSTETSPDKSEIERLAEAMERANNLWHTFGKGIMFGLGSTLGVAIIIIVLVYVLKQAQFVPWFGDKIKDFVAPIVDQLQQNSAIR